MVICKNILTSYKIFFKNRSCKKIRSCKIFPIEFWAIGPRISKRLKISFTAFDYNFNTSHLVLTKSLVTIIDYQSSWIIYFYIFTLQMNWYLVIYLHLGVNCLIKYVKSFVIFLFHCDVKKFSIPHFILDLSCLFLILLFFC